MMKRNFVLIILILIVFISILSSKRALLSKKQIAMAKAEKGNNVLDNIQVKKSIEEINGIEIETSLRVYCLEVEKWKSEELLVKKFSKELETGKILQESSVLDREKLTYKSSDENIVKVDKYGNVMGISEGEAQITISDGILTNWCTVFVKNNEENPIFKIEVSDISETRLGAKYKKYIRKYRRV